MTHHELQAGTIKTSGKAKTAGHQQVPPITLHQKQHPHAGGKPAKTPEHNRPGPEPLRRNPGRNGQQGANSHGHSEQGTKLNIA